MSAAGFMRIGDLRRERDYNRALWAPIRLARIPLVWCAAAGRHIWRWASAPRRAWWARPTLLGTAGLAITFPFDGPLQAGARAIGSSLGGDLLRELEVLQQYGALGSLTLIALIIWLQDVHRRARLLDLAAAIISTGAIVLLMKGLIGRVRPRGHMLADYGPMHILGPFGAVPGEPGEGVIRPWQFLAEGVSDIHSMPSSHTAYAVALSVFLLSMYPRLRPLLIAMPIVVGLCRVLFGAHWPSDVVVGAAVGAITATAAVRVGWSRRLCRAGAD